jgi:hypothetical protein
MNFLKIILIGILVVFSGVYRPVGRWHGDQPLEILFWLFVIGPRRAAVVEDVRTGKVERVEAPKPQDKLQNSN